MTNLLHSPYAALARGLLAMLSDEDLASLVKTASGGRIQPVDKKEACSAVLLSCPDVSKLLSYRKLTSHLLLQYLFTQSFAPNGHVSRTQLVVTILELWDKHLKKKKEADRNEMKGQKIEQHPHQKEPQLNPNTSHISVINSATNPNSLTSFGNPNSPPAYHQHSSSSGGTAMNHLNNSLGTTITIMNDSTAVTTTRQTLQTHTHSQQTSTSVVRVMSDEFSQEFCEWFYTMLNRLQPECSPQPGDTLRPDIFCSNCKTEMYLVEEGRQEECKAEGGAESERIIRQLLLKLKLLFAPNTTDGTQARKSSHGMIQLFCCGTIHSGNSFLGIFEQEFGLVVSPIDKAWKIAYTKVNLKKVNSVQTPSLPRCEVFAIEM